MPRPYLVAENLCFSYDKAGKAAVLDGLNLTFYQGEITLITGESGCGKSTLAHILAGLYPKNSGYLQAGRVTALGQDVHALSPDSRVGLVTMLFQNPNLQFCMSTLGQELAFCLENRGIAPDLWPQRIKTVAKRLNVERFLDREFSKLSGGEKQRCALCCALCLESDCLILDEAFSNVDEKGAAALVALVVSLGLTLVVVDHNEALWTGHYHRKIALTPTAEPPPPPPKKEGGRPILCVATGALHFSLREGSITALLGPSGIGKTTFFHSLIGKRPYEGDIFLEGKQLREIKKKAVYKQIGLVFQDPQSQFAALQVLQELTISTGGDVVLARALLKEFGLEHYETQSPYLLSGGQQRRLAVLTMLAGKQKILLLDEPTYGLDKWQTHRLMDFLYKRAEEGLTILMTTHHSQLAHQWASQVVTMEEALCETY